uniref:Uncharacterized protein n=1 Tax=Daphnia galeata TaxID=27404 RepID=A0A8J2WJA1_9CRUS|nr:unnamed protein product [Daphnia galeata]
MDDVVERQIVRSRHGKYIGQRELIWKSTQLKAAEEDAKLQKVASSGRSGGSSQKSTHSRSSMIRQDKLEEPRPGTSRQGELKGKHKYQTRYNGGRSPTTRGSCKL